MTAQFYLRLICVSLAMVLLPGSGHAAAYIKPDDSKEIFKLEKIPLQVDSMRELSKHLVVIARREHDASPAEQRATAQLLALAIRLDPASQDARETNDALAGKKHLQPSGESSMNTAKARLRFFSRWLANPEAGQDANQLSAYITDATKTLKAETAGNTDLANWSGIVPDVDRYVSSGKLPRPPKDDRTANPDRSSPDVGNGGHDPDDKPKPPKAGSDFHLKEQTVSAPFALQTKIKYRDPKEPGKDLYRTNYFSRIATVRLQLSPCKPDDKDRLSIKEIANKSHDDNSMHQNLGKLLYTLFVSRHSSLPHYRSKVTISNGSYRTSNGLSLATPLALMFEASIRNTPLREDIHVCALIDEKGRLSQPENFWEMLTALRESKAGGRLIVSPESAKLMIQVLVYDEPGFFTRWEVFSATNLDDALKVAAKHSESDLEKAEKIFDSIQNHARKTDVTKLAVNRVVRQRLAEIAELAPNHISAKILSLQGSGKRPMRLSEEALAHELIPIVQQMYRVLTDSISVDKISSSTCKAAHEAARAKLDKIERLVDRSHDSLYKDALDMANDFRRLQTIARRAVDVKSNDYKKARALYYDMVRSCEALHSRAMVAAGFPTPLKAEKK
ncbi:MAG: hypothetical protein H7A51_13185 [Akkermansiaceae bacterium]|nr:hypothetical protein [Akkermansiaceae bacterium]